MFGTSKHCHARRNLDARIENRSTLDASRKTARAFECLRDVDHVDARRWSQLCTRSERAHGRR